MGFRNFLACMAVWGVLALPVSVSAQTAETADQLIIRACTYGQTVDISHLQMTKEQVQDLFYQLYDGGKLPWYAKDSYTCHYDADTSIAQQFEPALLDRETYDRALYAQKAAEFLDTWIHDYMDPVQKALAIHDGLIVSCVYDESLEKNTGYDLLVNGSTVCLGYAQAYQYLLAQVGIESVVVTSEPMEHAWNLVKLDDRWYHVDVTWDDPTPDSYGFVNHAYFLLTDSEISAGEKPHHGWETDIVCDDNRYSQGFWRNITSQICFDEDQTAYFLRSANWDNYIYARDLHTEKETVIYTEKKNYLNIGHGQYCYEHGSISLWNGRLYYNTMDALISMNTAGGDKLSEHFYSYRLHRKVLYTCHITDGRIYATTMDHDGNPDTYTANFSGGDHHTHTYTVTTTEPTCLEPGYTQSVCDCGLTATHDPTAPSGHIYQQVDSKAATWFNAGWQNEVCSVCGDNNTVMLEQIPIPTKVYWIGGAGILLIAGTVLAAVLTGKKKTSV